MKFHSSAVQKLISHITASTLFGIGILALMLVGPSSASAQNAGSFDFFKTPGECNATECGWTQFVALGNEILKFAVYIAIIGATIAFAWAGFKMLMNAGSSGEIAKAKKIMWDAIIGLVITLSAWLIVKFILDNLGVGANFRTLIQ